MDKELIIPTSDNKSLYGIMRGSFDMPMVIFVHGLTSDIQEPKFYLGSRELHNAGIASYRYSQYSWHENSRKLDECSMTTLGEDLDSVIAYLRHNGVKDITLVGHSLGALVILKSVKQDYERFVFWDGSYDVGRWWKDLPYIKERDTYLIDSGFRSLVSSEMKREAQEDYLPAIAASNKPALFVYAKEGVLTEGGKSYFDAVKYPEKELCYIDGAGHNFDEEGVHEKLLEITKKWIRKQLITS